MTSTVPLDGGRPLQCFVVMGFGRKTDLATGRQLDLDKSYRNIIKPVVESRGIRCVRADEIRHSGQIDLPMYEQLLNADLVIADLSTANPNALYELGIRHALKPWTTIVISENKLPYPFDLNHVLITSYAHLGEEIGYDEVMRLRTVLGDLIDAVRAERRTDSPIYTFLHDLKPPQRVSATAASPGPMAAAAAPCLQPPESNPTLAAVIENGEAAIAGGRFVEARTLFTLALQITTPAPDPARNGVEVARDPYLVQRLALATYKARTPDTVTALREALKLLEALNPHESNDPETVGLAGAIEKRLFDELGVAEHLDRAIGCYGRGYYLRDDWYNGINLTYLLTLRADAAPDATDQERIADLVWANRIRRAVVALCDKDLQAIRARRQQVAGRPDICPVAPAAREHDREFWCLATSAEAHFGLGNADAHRAALAEAKALAVPHWMTETLDDQIARLKAMLGRRGGLLVPPWSAPS